MIKSKLLVLNIYYTIIFKYTLKNVFFFFRFQLRSDDGNKSQDKTKDTKCLSYAFCQREEAILMDV